MFGQAATLLGILVAVGYGATGGQSLKLVNKRVF